MTERLDYRIGDSLDNLSDVRFVCRRVVSHHCQSCGGEGRLYRLHRRKASWKMVKIVCRDCAGAVQRREPDWIKLMVRCCPTFKSIQNAQPARHLEYDSR